MNIQHLTSQAISNERKELKAQAKKLNSIPNIELPGVSRSTTLASGGLLVFCDNDWRSAYRALRQATGNRPNNISIYPSREPSTSASVNLEFKLGDSRVLLNFNTDDYQRFLKPGATCKRRSISETIVCE